VNRNYFDFLYIIGRGGFGKVWKVRLKKNNEFFALKEMSKVKIIDRRSEVSIMSERNLLSKLHHSFIVNMYFAFQDFYNLYLVMDLLTGGDLRYHIAFKKTFTEMETQFFIANMILALEYIHSKNILHRDIKPENLVLEKSGYLRITDFGVAKINEEDNSSETSGTPGYMAPEVILVLNHSFPSDFFALGVIGYEFMKGFRPYLGRSRKEIKQLILNKQAKIKKSEIPENWSLNSADFINKLLIRKGDLRLGHGGINELKEHPWMENIDWKLLAEKKVQPPFVPKSSENYDKKYCEGDDEIGEETIERYQIYAQNELYPDVFKNYTFCNLSYISNYHIKRLKRFKESNINIRDIVEKNVDKVLKEENNNLSNLNSVKKINENIKENKNESMNSSIKINKNNSDININKNKSKYNVNNNKKGKIKNHSKSVEDLKQYNINNNNDPNDTNNNKEVNSTTSKSRINNKNNKLNRKENYFTIDTNKLSNKNTQRKKISLSKEKINYDNIKKNFKENIIYNNYINLHFNDFSTNKNYNNSNNINIESNSSTKKKLSAKVSSHNTNKTKSKMNNILNKKNKIVKSSSMKLLENVGNKNLFEEILSNNKNNGNNKHKNKNRHFNENKKIEKNNNIKTINHIKLDNFRNAKKIIENKAEIKTTKNKNVLHLNLAKKLNKNVKGILHKKLDLFMDIIYNNSNDINNFNNLNSNEKIPKKTENKIYINRIGKCHSSCGFYTNSKTVNANKKKNINLKMAKKKHRNLSMQNISNSGYNDIYTNKNISNYNTLNINLNQNSKNNMRIKNNKKYITFYSLNNTSKYGNKCNKKLLKNKNDIKNILNTKKSIYTLNERHSINKKSQNKNTSKSRHKSNII
jgi:serine/threonine protein kinase